MRKIWMLVTANIRKNKSQAVSLLIFVLIAAMFLNVGLVIFFGIGSFIDKRAEQNHTAHFTAAYNVGADSIAIGLQYMENYPQIEETEILDVIGGKGNYFYGDTKYSCFLFLSQANEQQRMDVPSFVGDYLPLNGNAIYIPYFIMLGGDFEIGDDFRLLLSGIELNFTIAGATEEIMYGAQMNNVHRFYIPDKRYSELVEQFPNNGVTVLSARLDNSGDTVFFQADYDKDVSTEGLLYHFVYDDAKWARTMIPLIVAIIVTTFAIILLAISLIVIRFRIVNSIEESMTNIGAQKAIGYRSSQIISAIVVQFACIAVFGGIVGIMTAQVVIPVIMKILEPMIALVWNPGFDIVMATISLLSILLTVSFISFVSAWRIKKLHPLIALRGGITVHNFKKNTFPLDKAWGSLNLLLALKHLLQNKKQTVTIGIIIAAVTMASVSGIAINYTMNGGQDNFSRLISGEIPDANFTLKNSGDGESFKERLLERTEVRKVFGYENSQTLLVDETSILTIVVEDCSLLEGSMIIDGRYPKHDNEIALGAFISKSAGKTCGDMVMVKSGETEKEYLVTGIVQFAQGNGFSGMITGGGMREIQPDYQFARYNVYLKDGVDTKTFLQNIQMVEGDIFNSVVDAQEEVKITMDSMSGIFAAVAAGIIAVTAFIVILVLYMVIKTTIIRRKHELGIQKAIGFTTFQLMNQIALNMTPIILFGVILGAVAGFFGFNPIFLAVTSSMGIVKVELPVPFGQTFMVCIVMVIFAYCVSMLNAWRIRKISAYSLISE